MHTEDTPATTTTTPAKRFQCRHILADGHQCGSVCLRHEKFCYFHHTARLPIRDAPQRQARRATSDLPLIEDRASIQVAIAGILRRIAANQLDPRRAGLLLYGLQIASVNLPKLPAINTAALQPTVEEITEDPTLGLLAPESEYSETGPGKRELTLEEILERQWAQDKHLYGTAANPHPTNPEPPTPQTLPSLQATAQPDPCGKRRTRPAKPRLTHTTRSTANASDRPTSSNLRPWRGLKELGPKGARNQASST